MKHIPRVTLMVLFTLTPSTTSASPSSAQIPDLCDEPILSVDGSVYEDSTGFALSRWCSPHADPPVWAEPLCCVIGDDAHCTTPTSRGTCPSGMKFWCEHGEQHADGQVTCYQDGRGACESGFCTDVDAPEGPDVFLATIWVCCYEMNDIITCVHHAVTPTGQIPTTECGGFLAMCNWGRTNIDGTIDCYG